MSYKYFNGKRNIGGTAALLHQVKKDGGLNKHYMKVLERMGPALIEGMIDEVNKKNILKRVK